MSKKIFRGLSGAQHTAAGAVGYGPVVFDITPYGLGGKGTKGMGFAMADGEMDGHTRQIGFARRCIGEGLSAIGEPLLFQRIRQQSISKYRTLVRRDL